MGNDKSHIYHRQFFPLSPIEHIFIPSPKSHFPTVPLSIILLKRLIKCTSFKSVEEWLSGIKFSTSRSLKTRFNHLTLHHKPNANLKSILIYSDERSCPAPEAWDKMK